MKKIFITLLLFSAHFIYSQVITDTVAFIIRGESVRLLYDKYDSEMCFTKGEYVKGIIDSSVIFPYDISKCRRYSGSEEYVTKAYYKGETYFFNMDKDAKDRKSVV